MEEYSKKSEDTPKLKSKLTCSFSIERILRKEDKQDRTEDSDERRGTACCEDSMKKITKVDYESPPTSPCRSYPICPHPVCPIPSNPLIYPESMLSYYAQKNFPSYFSLAMLHKGINNRSYLPGGSGFSCGADSYRQMREKDLSPPIGNFYKQAINNDDGNDLNSKRKGGQVRFSHVQSVELERIFNHQKYISPQERKQLSRYLHLSERQVKTWFQNRRAKWRRVKMEAEMRRRLAQESAIRERFGSQREKQTDLSLLDADDYKGNKHLTKEACML